MRGFEARLTGQTPDGLAVTGWRLTNASGAALTVSALGACWTGLTVPDRQGAMEDVLLGYPAPGDLWRAPGYMGMTIGRYGNRIGGAAFTLNGKRYTLRKNDGDNHLHGGVSGFDKKLWRGERAGDALALTMVSPDGEEGYPGTLTVSVTYTLADDNTVRIAYRAETDADTVVNLTNHAYFNLLGPGGAGIGGHVAQMEADCFTEVADAACIPTGRLAPVVGTALDLTQPRAFDDVFARVPADRQLAFGRGIDHNFVIRGYTGDGALRRAAVIREPSRGRRLEVWTDQPGIQLYTGNFLGDSDVPGKAGVPYRYRQGFCLETQHFPDSPNHESFPTVTLRAGQVFRSVTEYRFGVDA